MAIVLQKTQEGLFVNAIIRRVGNLLNDEDHTRWPVTELFDWINDAATQAIVKLPTVRSVTQDITLVDGALQTLPSDRAMTLLDITRNKSADGTIGSAIRIADRQQLDDYDSDWYLGTRSQKIEHYTFDERTPRNFYVYPPAQSGTIVEAVFTERPVDVAATGQVVDISEQYLSAIVNYICFRALSKEAEVGIPPMAVNYYQSFLNDLNIDMEAGLLVTPNEASQ